MKKHVFREQKRHGEPDFPIQYYGIDREHPRYEMNLHWHPEFEIVRVRRGGLVLFLDNTECRLQAGDIAFVGGGVLHRAEPQDCVYECIVFDLNLFTRYAPGRITAYVLGVLAGEVKTQPVTGDSPFCAPVNTLFDCLREASAYHELRVYGSLCEILYLLCREGWVKLSCAKKTGGHRRQTITALLDWIEQNYTERITLSRLAQIAKSNEKYLCRFFREYTGCTPIDYINRLRVERACLHMIEENASVTEAALDSGFNDISYFCKIFKRYKGVAPGEYRRPARSEMQNDEKI